MSNKKDWYREDEVVNYFSYMKKNKASNFFTETYIVNLDYQKQDSVYFVHSHNEEVSLKIKHGQNEKNNHDLAAEIAKQRFPNCRVNSVTYC